MRPLRFWLTFQSETHFLMLKMVCGVGCICRCSKKQKPIQVEQRVKGSEFDYIS